MGNLTKNILLVGRGKQMETNINANNMNLFCVKGQMYLKSGSEMVLHDYRYYEGFKIKQKETADSIQILRNNNYKLKNGSVGMYTGSLCINPIEGVDTVCLVFQKGKSSRVLHVYPLDYVVQDLGNTFGMDLHRMLLNPV